MHPICMQHVVFMFLIKSFNAKKSQECAYINDPLHSDCMCDINLWYVDVGLVSDMPSSCAEQLRWFFFIENNIPDVNVFFAYIRDADTFEL